MDTEKRASEKWCPMTAPEDLHGSPRIAAAGHNCIASGCMMWRWDKYVMFFPETNSLRTASVIDGKDLGAPKGFCGLRGQP